MFVTNIKVSDYGWDIMLGNAHCLQHSWRTKMQEVTLVSSSFVQFYFALVVTYRIKPHANSVVVGVPA
jgi:hypothetical protein